MNRSINITPIAQSDLRRILRWLTSRSPQGSDSWYRAFWSMAEKIGEDAESFPVVDESLRLMRRPRQAIFKTRKGRRYRIIFEITDSEVFILRVRRPGQRPLRKRDIPIR